MQEALKTEVLKPMAIEYVKEQIDKNKKKKYKKRKSWDGTRR